MSPSGLLLFLHERVAVLAFHLGRRNEYRAHGATRFHSLEDNLLVTFVGVRVDNVVPFEF